MALFCTSLLLSAVAVINTAAAASLGDKTDPVGSGCVATDSLICKSVGAPEGCSLEMTTTGLTPDLMKAVLEKHNQVRRKVAKGEYEFAAKQLNRGGMKKLVWNETLASSAQGKVNDQCSNNRSDVPGADASFKRSWLLSDPANTTMEVEEDIEKIIQYWFDLVILGGGSLPPFNQSKTDFSVTGWDGTRGTPASSIAGNALISTGTKSLGCGLVIYSKENWRMLEMLCFYDSSILLPTSPGYQVGDPCDSCQFWWPAGPLWQCDDGLCAPGNPLNTTTESGSTDTSTLDLEVGKLVRQLVKKLISLVKN